MLDRHSHSAPTAETAEMAALFCLSALDMAEKERFDLHLSDCEICREHVRDYAVLLEKWALSTGAELPSGARERFLSRLHSDEEPADNAVVLNRDGLLIARSSAIEWQAGAAPGIWAKPLFSDPVRKYGTTLVRMDKGVRYPRHRHADVEEVYLLAGDLQVEGNSMGSGDYCRAEPDSIHNESFTVAGCLFILKSSQMDEVLG